jgi:5-methylcytosine-specific restriction endonuclease McrA
MARSVDGENAEFSREDREFVFQWNHENAPRGCVGYWCEWCHFSSMHRHYFEVDHIIPVAKAAQYGVSADFVRSIDNACVLCKGCNGSKSDRDYPRYGVGLAFRAPNQNLTWGERRAPALDFDEMVQMAKRKGRYRLRG